jgi:hypothetical protein
LNVSIHHQWASLFALDMNLESQNSTYNNASNNFNFEYEEIHYTSTNSMIHYFLDVSKMKILYIPLPQVKIFTF